METDRNRLPRTALAKRLRALARSRAIQLLAPAVMIALLYGEGRKEFARIDWKTTWATILETDLPTLLLLAAFSLAAVASVSAYDFILRWRYRVPIGRWDVFRYAWIANTSNSVFGIAGLAGASLRTLLYRRKGVPLRTIGAWIAFLSTITVTGLSLLSWAGIAGLLPIDGLMAAHPWLRLLVWADALSLPVLILIHRSRLLAVWIHGEPRRTDWITIAVSVGASLTEWFLAATAFWLVAACLLPGLSMADGLGVYTAASVAGLFSIAPGGIGGFDLTALLGLASLGRDAGASAAVLMLYRVLYYLIPWLIGLAMAAFEFAAQSRRAPESGTPEPSGGLPTTLPNWAPRGHPVPPAEFDRDFAWGAGDGATPEPAGRAGEVSAEEAAHPPR